MYSCLNNYNYNSSIKFFTLKKLAFITGATSGIGAACAQLFAHHGYDLVITGRRKDRLQTLKEKLESTFGASVTILAFDVQDKQATIDAIGQIKEQLKYLNLLINNAGLSLGRDSVVDADIRDWEVMMQTNVNGLMYVTKALLPFLIENKGHIINVGSIAGKEVYENGNGYCASKFAVDALSKAMRIDLLQYGVKVTAIHPGAVVTEFSVVRYKGDQEKADAVYKGFQPLSPEDIAETIYYTASLPPHVCINEMVITPTQQASTFHFHKTP